MIVVDGNSIGFSATAANDLRAGLRQTGGAFGFLRSLREIRESYPGEIYIAWDGRSWRYEAYADYKANRKVNPKLVEAKENWAHQRKLVARALYYIGGINQVFVPNWEADDIAAHIVRTTSSEVSLISGDKDWAQLVNPRVIWADPIRGRIANMRNFGDVLSWKTPQELVWAKALEGDPSDNISGVGGIGEVGARWIFDHYGSPFRMSLDYHGAQIEESVWASHPKKIRSLLEDKEKWARFERNMALIDLNWIGIPPAKEYRVVKSHTRMEEFVDFCGEYAFHSILRDPAAWLRPFETLNHERIVA